MGLNCCHSIPGFCLCLDRYSGQLLTVFCPFLFSTSTILVSSSHPTLLSIRKCPRKPHLERKSHRPPRPPGLARKPSRRCRTRCLRATRGTLALVSLDDERDMKPRLWRARRRVDVGCTLVDRAGGSRSRTHVYLISNHSLRFHSLRSLRSLARIASLIQARTSSPPATSPATSNGPNTCACSAKKPSSRSA